MLEAPPFSLPERFSITLTLPQRTLGAFDMIETLGNWRCFGIAGTLGCHTRRRMMHLAQGDSWHTWLLHKEMVDALGYRTRRRFSHLAIAWSSRVCIWRVATKWQIRLWFGWPDLRRIALRTSVHINRKPDWSCQSEQYPAKYKSLWLHPSGPFVR